MNLFDKAKNNKPVHRCHICKNKYTPHKGNLKRGDGLFCSKSCAAKWKYKKKTKAEIRDFKLKQIGI